MAQRQLVRPFLKNFTTFRYMSSSDPGSGAGKGGGSGGSIRDAGGAFGKLEAAREEEYFHKLKKSQLKELRGELIREIRNHEQIVERHKRRVSELHNEEKNLKQ